MEIIVDKKCIWCNSGNLTYAIDSHNHRTNDGARYGVATCEDCHQVMFWYHKNKEKFGIKDGRMTVECHPVVALVASWDGPITPFIYAHIEKSASITGRPMNTYYTNQIGPNCDTQRYFQVEQYEKEEMCNGIQ